MESSGLKKSIKVKAKRRRGLKLRGEKSAGEKPEEREETQTDEWTHRSTEPGANTPLLDEPEENFFRLVKEAITKVEKKCGAIYTLMRGVGTLLKSRHVEKYPDPIRKMLNENEKLWKDTTKMALLVPDQKKEIGD